MKAKRCLALLLILALAVCMTACSKRGSSRLSGTWLPIRESLSMDGEERLSLTLKDMTDAATGIEPSLRLDEGGNGSFDLYGGDPTTITWSENGNTLTLSAAGESMDLTYDEDADQLTLVMEEEGLTAQIVFAREGSSAAATSRNTSGTLN